MEIAAVADTGTACFSPFRQRECRLGGANSLLHREIYGEDRIRQLASARIQGSSGGQNTGGMYRKITALMLMGAVSF